MEYLEYRGRATIQSSTQYFFLHLPLFVLLVWPGTAGTVNYQPIIDRIDIK